LSWTYKVFTHVALFMMIIFYQVCSFIRIRRSGRNYQV